MARFEVVSDVGRYCRERLAPVIGGPALPARPRRPVGFSSIRRERCDGCCNLALLTGAAVAPCMIATDSVPCRNRTPGAPRCRNLTPTDAERIPMHRGQHDVEHAARGTLATGALRGLTRGVPARRRWVTLKRNGVTVSLSDDAPPTRAREWKPPTRVYAAPYLAAPARD